MSEGVTGSDGGGGRLIKVGAFAIVGSTARERFLTQLRILRGLQVFDGSFQ